MTRKQPALVARLLERFAAEFVRDPYLCYTEHGLHALFYAKLLTALPDAGRFTSWNGTRVCTIQKEYRTAGTLGKSKRQHWDIALLKVPLHSACSGRDYPYDNLRLAAVVEFGLNAGEKHLLEDIRRLGHPDANVDNTFVAHFCRLTTPGAAISARDRSTRSKSVVTVERAAQLVAGKPVQLVYAQHVVGNASMSYAYSIAGGKKRLLT